MAVVRSRQLRPNDQYTASVPLQPAPMPRVNLDTSGAKAIAGFGNALSNLAEVSMQKDKEREDFKAANDYAAFELQMQDQLKQTEDQYSGTDAAGLHDQFITETFKPARDKFLSGLPERLRERYGTILSDNPESPGKAYERLSIGAAATERDTRYDWYRTTIASTQEELQKAISVDPDGFDQYYQQGLAVLEAGGLPKGEKDKIRESWKQMAAIAYTDRLLEDRPEDVLRALNVDPRKLNPTAKKEVLWQALLQQENATGDPNAVSGAGAVGLAQVMPETARWIAKQVGDKTFPHGQSTADVVNYLKNPNVSLRYGRYYLDQQLKDFNGEIEAALIAYNGGPQRAKDWIAAGRNDDVLPKETREYYHKILDKMMYVGAGAAKRAMTVPESAKNVQFIDATAGKTRNLPIQPTVKNKIAAAAAATDPRLSIKITSGGQVTKEEAAQGLGKRTGSTRHDHGGAADIVLVLDGKEVLPSQNRELYAQFFENAARYGFTGMGHYSWGIHVGGGSEHFWGPTKSEKTADPYFKAAVERGRAQRETGSGGDPRLTGLTYAQRQAYMKRAEAAVTARGDGKPTTADKLELRRQMDNELALTLGTGAGTPSFDETNIASVLGEAEYAKWVHQKEVNEKIFAATSGIKEMTPEEMDARFDEYKRSVKPGTDSYSTDVEVRDALESEIQRITRLRAKNPGAAAEEFDDVKQAKQSLVDATENGTKAFPPAEMQKFVELMLERQKEIGIPRAAAAPIPKAWAMTIGRGLSEIPTLGVKMKGANDEVLTTRSELAKIYDKMKTLYGDYADEVIIYALSEYKGIDKDTAGAMTAWMTMIGAGKPADQVLRTVQRNTEIDRQDPSMWDRVKGWFTGDDTPEEQAINPEVLRRTVEELRSADTPEEREAIRVRRGDRAFEAAQQQVQ